MKRALVLFTFLLITFCCKGQEQIIEVDPSVAARLYQDSLVAFDSSHSYSKSTRLHSHSLVFHRVKNPKLYWERRQKIIRLVDAATILFAPYQSEYNNSRVGVFIAKLNRKFYDYSDDLVYNPIEVELHDVCMR